MRQYILRYIILALKEGGSQRDLKEKHCEKEMKIRYDGKDYIYKSQQSNAQIYSGDQKFRLRESRH